MDPENINTLLMSLGSLIVSVASGVFSIIMLRMKMKEERAQKDTDISVGSDSRASQAAESLSGAAARLAEKYESQYTRMDAEIEDLRTEVDRLRARIEELSKDLLECTRQKQALIEQVCEAGMVPITETES